ncbi:MAG: DNA-3-methyladenine glycosylase [Planctomycetales bacterium]|nr:DNA-3-methyladenine glycosylase [Planctomycetales bacterium]
MSARPLPREFYDRDVVQVARDLLGKRLTRVTAEGTTSGAIVEVEAYRGQHDPAAHSYRGQTARNATMFGPPGHLYVYTIHAKFCMNVVTEPAGVAHAVLIRGVEPLDGLPLMQQRRGREPLVELTRGPARLCQAMSVDRTLDGWDLTLGREIWIADEQVLPMPDTAIIASPRIGISSAQDALLRFFVNRNAFVSGPKRYHR